MTLDLKSSVDDLYRAIMGSDVDSVQLLLRRQPELASQRFGTSMLFDRAVRSGSVPMIEAFYDAGADVNCVDGATVFNSPLAEANAHVADWMLRHGALPDAHPSTAVSPLSCAAIGGDLECARLLVEAGADIHWEGTIAATPLALARSWKFLNKGQDKVAEYLESKGSVSPYSEWHRWLDPQVEFVERSVGVVNPRSTSCSFEKHKVRVYKSRFGRNKHATMLLFTSGLRGFEVGIVLPPRWRLNRNALVEQRFAWPHELLFRISEAVLAGASLAHGDTLAQGDAVLRDLEMPFDHWLLVNSQLVESKRREVPDTVPILLLTPVTTKKLYKPGKEAVGQADKRAAFKWERLHLPLPDMTPLGYDRETLLRL